MERVGQNTYFFNGAPDELQRVSKPSIKQGALEGSNVML